MRRWLTIVVASLLVAGSCSTGGESDATDRPAGPTTSPPAGSSSAASSSTASSSTASSSTASSSTAVPTSPPPTFVNPPAETDVEVLAEFVERHSGLEFADPPEVSRLELSELGIDAENFVDRELWVLFAALGLVENDDEARIAAGRARLDQVRGVCCPVGMFPTDDHELLTSVVLVHELTHLIDLQRAFGDSSVDQSIYEPIDPGLAVIEGNAQRVARIYQNELLAAGADPAVFAIDWGEPRIPDAILEVMEFPYFEGADFSAALEAKGGLGLVEESFDRLPSSTEQILDFDAYLDEEDPIDVPVPFVAADDQELSVGTIGALALRILAQAAPGRPGADDAIEERLNRLVTRWAGDTYVLYESEGRTCVRATVVMDDADSAEQLSALIRAAGPSITRPGTDGTTFELSSCSSASPA